MRMATFVSRSGGWMSTIRPHSKRDRRRSARGRDVVRGAVAADDDLLLGVVQGVERVEELGLRPLLAGEELDVVHQQDVDVAVALAEAEHPLVLHRVDHLVHEALGRDVGQLQPGHAVEQVLADRVHQVRLAESHAAVEEQRVVGAGGRLGDRDRGGVRELVRRADDERRERVARVQAARRRRLRFRGSGLVGYDGRFGRRIRSRSRGSLRVEDEGNLQSAALDLARRLGNDAGVVLGEPVAAEDARHPDGDPLAVVRDERGRLEPGTEAALVDLGLDSRQDLRPDVA